MDPRQQLETTIAYLRLAIRDGGLSLDVPEGRAYTLDLRALVKRSDLVMLRPSRGSARQTVLHASPQGVDRPASVLDCYGDEFGPVEALDHVENVERDTSVTASETTTDDAFTFSGRVQFESRRKKAVKWIADSIVDRHWTV